MNGNHVMHTYLHWFWTAFFALYAIFLATRASGAGSARSASCGLRLAANETGSLEQRVKAAVERRQESEGQPAPLGLWAGAVSAVLATVAALNVVQPALLYATLCLSMALFAAIAFWRLRNSQPTRVAVLSLRTSESVIPSYWFAAAVLSSLSVLAYATIAAYQLSAILVCVSALSTTYIAWRTTMLPAMLSGVDIPAEQLVDDRLRFRRSTLCMVYAVVQTFVFCSQVIDQETALQLAAYAFTTVVWIAFAVWFVFRQRRVVRLA